MIYIRYRNIYFLFFKFIINHHSVVSNTVYKIRFRIQTNTYRSHKMIAVSTKAARIISSFNGRSVNVLPLNIYDVEFRTEHINNIPPSFNILPNRQIVCLSISYDGQALSRQNLEKIISNYC